MNGQASDLTTRLFLALAIVMIGLWGFASDRATRGADGRPRGGRAWLLYAAGAAVWFLVPLLAARDGNLDRWTTPPPSMVLIALVTVFTIALALSPVGARLAEIAPLSWLVGFQAFRIAVELLLHRLYVEGVIPVQMTYAGRNFDIVSGVGAVVVAIVLASGRRSRGLVLGWNVIGLLLLANIVTIAVLSTPTAFRAFMNEPANRLPGVPPFVLLPTLLVQAALFGHLLVFRSLARRPA